jgi:RNA polymerase sigma-70 factor (ECF subfamily)
MNETEFYALAARYRESIARIIYRLVHSQEDTRDLMQDAFMQLWNHHRQMENQRAAYTYLYRTAINLAIDWLRHRKYEIGESVIEPVQPGSGTPKDSRELFEATLACSRHLKPKQRAVFILKDLEGFEFDEIAVLMNTSPANLRSNLYLARKKIKETLAKQYDITMEYWYDL